MPGTAKVDVCIVEDDSDQRRLLRSALERQGYKVGEASDAGSAMGVLRCERPKVVILDYQLPDGDGLDLAAQIRQDADLSSMFVVMITAHGDYDLHELAITRGADDYLNKPIKLPDLFGRVRVGVRMWDLQHRLRSAAITDGLTGLYNHDHINRLLALEINRARRYGHSLSLMMVDIDFFKAVNDTFGHLVGNDVLEETARILRESVRGADVVGRFGGEEFAIVLPESNLADAAALAERIRLGIAIGIDVPALGGHPVTASFGVADTNDPRVTSASVLVDLADQALYLSKRRGRNRVSTALELEDGEAVGRMIEVDEVESLRRRVAALSVQAKDVYVQSIGALLQALDEKDPYSARHAKNVSFYAERVARQMGCSPGIVKSIANAALLHDIGKVGIPDRVLLKPNPLAPIERSLMDQVPNISIRIVDHLRILEAETQIIRHHREHFDGNGRPNGLVGNQIPIGARIVMLADAFDAMTTDRVYRHRRSIEETVSELQALSGSQFDPRAVTALRQLLGTERRSWEARIRDTVEALRVHNDVL